MCCAILSQLVDNAASSTVEIASYTEMHCHNSQNPEAKENYFISN